MYPELFEIPFTHWTVKSYGLMMVLAFLAAIFVIRRLSRDITPNPQLITNAALYSLIAGVAGARLFYVVHYFRDQFRGDLLSVFAIWQGGLELLGGVLLAIAVIVLYLWRHKLPARHYLDILAIGLMAALAVGRIGCFLNGCCFGKPTDLPWAVRFPYGSFAYRSQVKPDLDRNRPQPQLKVSDEFFGYYNDNGQWIQDLKPKKYLTEQQKQMLKKNDKSRSLPVHPTQLYSSANGAILCLILYLLWRRSQHTGRSFIKPGYIFGLMFIFYGITRFFIEFLRDDNPFEMGRLAISQLTSITLIAAGFILMIIFQKMKPYKQNSV
jgi:phosphatidylglycerol:prolipoprotein diacylglycerol transferase